MNCSTECTRDFFRGWNALSNVELIYLEGLKDQESYFWCFWRLNNINQVMRDDFTCCKTLSKVEPICLEVKLKKAKFN